MQDYVAMVVLWYATPNKKRPETTSRLLSSEADKSKLQSMEKLLDRMLQG